MTRLGKLARDAWLVAGLSLAMIQAVVAQEVGVAARVNGVEITVFRLERHFEDYLKSQGRNVGAIRNPNAYKRLKREALEQLIDVELLWQEAQRRRIVADEEEVAASLAQSEAAFRTRDAWLSKLAAAGFDEATYRDYLRRDIAARLTFASLGDGADPEDDAVRQFLAANRERFVKPGAAAGKAPEPMAEAEAMPIARSVLARQLRMQRQQSGLQSLRDAAKIERPLPL